MMHLPDDTTTTGALQQWHVPPKCNVTPFPVKEISFFQKWNMGRCQRRRKEEMLLLVQSEYTANADAVDNILQTISKCFPESGLFQFWNGDNSTSSSLPITNDKTDSMDKIAHFP